MALGLGTVTGLKALQGDARFLRYLAFLICGEVKAVAFNACLLRPSAHPSDCRFR